MSGSQLQQSGAPAAGGGADPSMEDILASIRRILSEEDLPEDKAPPPAPPVEQEPDVLLLDASMLVPDQPERHIPERSHAASHPIIARSAPPPAPPLLIPPEMTEAMLHPAEPEPPPPPEAPEVTPAEPAPPAMRVPPAVIAPMLEPEPADKVLVGPPHAPTPAEPAPEMLAQPQEPRPEPQSEQISATSKVPVFHAAREPGIAAHPKPGWSEPPIQTDPVPLPAAPDTARPVPMKTESRTPPAPEFAPAVLVKTEPPMPAEAIPALAVGSMASLRSPMERVPLEPEGQMSARPSTAGLPSLVGRLPASPVLVPVPRPGQAPPLIRRPMSATRESPLPPPPSRFAPAEPAAQAPPEPSSAPSASAPLTAGSVARLPVTETTSPNQTATPPQSETSSMSASIAGLASVETANAAAGSVTNLVRALTSDRGTQVFSGGPTIADLVREEMRPMLKAWLDNNLPPLVERLVRAEIERVISRASV